MSILSILENFFAENGKTDILGFSYYPYWEKFESDRKGRSRRFLRCSVSFTIL